MANDAHSSDQSVYAPRDNGNKPKFLCRVIGHRWKPSHRKDTDKHGMPIWVYIDDVCTRCYCTDWRMPWLP